MLDDIANRYAWRWCFNTEGLYDIDKELCLNYMNVLTDIKLKAIMKRRSQFMLSNILDSHYITLSNLNYKNPSTMSQSDNNKQDKRISALVGKFSSNNILSPLFLIGIML